MTTIIEAFIEPVPGMNLLSNISHVSPGESLQLDDIYTQPGSDVFETVLVSNIENHSTSILSENFSHTISEGQPGVIFYAKHQVPTGRVGYHIVNKLPSQS